MGKKKKSCKKNNTTEKILLATAITQLLSAIIAVIKTVTELFD